MIAGYCAFVAYTTRMTKSNNPKLLSGYDPECKFESRGSREIQVSGGKDSTWIPSNRGFVTARFMSGSIGHVHYDFWLQIPNSKIEIIALPYLYGSCVPLNHASAPARSEPNLPMMKRAVHTSLMITFRVPDAVSDAQNSREPAVPEHR